MRPIHIPIDSLSRQVAEARELGLKQQLYGANGPIAVLGHDHFGDASVWGFGVVVLIAVDHQHQVGVLLNRSRFAQVAQHGAFVGA